MLRQADIERGWSLVCAIGSDAANVAARAGTHLDSLTFGPAVRATPGWPSWRYFGRVSYEARPLADITVAITEVPGEARVRHAFKP